MRKIVGIGETVLDINFRKSHLRDLRDTFENIQENCRLSDVVRGSSEDFVFFIVCCLNSVKIIITKLPTKLTSVFE